MIDPDLVAFDIDGVIAHTMQLFLDILKTVYGVNHIDVLKDDGVVRHLNDLDSSLISPGQTLLVPAG